MYLSLKVNLCLKISDANLNTGLLLGLGVVLKGFCVVFKMRLGGRVFSEVACYLKY